MYCSALLNFLMKLSDKNIQLKIPGNGKPEPALAEALLSSEVRYRRLFESAKDGILILDAETGTIIDVNPFLADLLGYPKEDLVEKDIWEIGFFKDIAANKEKLFELQEKEYVRYDNLPLETVDGRKINVEFVSNVYLANKKKVIQCNIRDITERKRSEKALILSENRLHTLFQTIPDLIWLKDVEGKYLACNPMFSRFFGASEAEIKGKTDYDFVNKELADFFLENDRQ
jgi:two-component system CheB/CheR fusion protein